MSAGGIGDAAVKTEIKPSELQPLLLLQIGVCKERQKYLATGPNPGLV